MRFFTTVHILLLCYIIAAIAFWGISLHKQSKETYKMQRIILASEIDSNKHPGLYQPRLTEIRDKKDSRTKQYVGEGITFIIVILV